MMKERRRGVRSARLLLVVDVVAISLALPLAADGPEFLATVVVALWLLVASVVGGVVAMKRPDHPIGWLLLTTGAFIGLSTLTREYALLALGGSSGNLPGGEAAGWLSSWLPLPGFVAFGLVLILFPTGRPRSAFWRMVVLAGIALGAIMTVSVALMPGAIDGVRVGEATVRNPFGIEQADRILRVAFEMSGALLLIVGLCGVAGRLISFRGTQGQQRQQLKWFIFAIGLVLLGFVSNILTTSTINEEDVTYHVLAFFVPMIAVLAIPVAMGVAILRYRLYDIDVIINRALVYGGLTALLGGAYVAVVTVAGTLMRGSQIATAGATLAVAALFRPLRRRVQGFIDRRFYRRRYDASRTLDAFSARLRDEVDLEAMRAELVLAVQDTMQPRLVSMWLKQEMPR